MLQTNVDVEIERREVRTRNTDDHVLFRRPQLPSIMPQSAVEGAGGKSILEFVDKTQGKAAAMEARRTRAVRMKSDSSDDEAQYVNVSSRARAAAPAVAAHVSVGGDAAADRGGGGEEGREGSEGKRKGRMFVDIDRVVSPVPSGSLARVMSVRSGDPMSFNFNLPTNQIASSPLRESAVLGDRFRGDGVADSSLDGAAGDKPSMAGPVPSPADGDGEDVVGAVDGKSVSVLLSHAASVSASPGDARPGSSSRSRPGTSTRPRSSRSSASAKRPRSGKAGSESAMRGGTDDVGGASADMVAVGDVAMAVPIDTTEEIVQEVAEMVGEEVEGIEGVEVEEGVTVEGGGSGSSGSSSPERAAPLGVDAPTAKRRAADLWGDDEAAEEDSSEEEEVSPPRAVVPVRGGAASPPPATPKKPKETRKVRRVVKKVVRKGADGKPAEVSKVVSEVPPVSRRDRSVDGDRAPSEKEGKGKKMKASGKRRVVRSVKPSDRSKGVEAGAAAVAAGAATVGGSASPVKSGGAPEGGVAASSTVRPMGLSGGNAAQAEGGPMSMTQIARSMLRAQKK